MYSQRKSGTIFPDDRWYCCLPLYHSSGRKYISCCAAQVVYHRLNSFQSSLPCVAPSLSEVRLFYRPSSQLPSVWRRSQRLNPLGSLILVKLQDTFALPHLLHMTKLTKSALLLVTVSTSLSGISSARDSTFLSLSSSTARLKAIRS
jgi:hypothetical protein